MTTNIQHKPWVGSHYTRRDDRLLILGDSHHCEDPSASNMTVPVITDWISGTSNSHYAFFTKLAIALSGKPKEDVSRDDVFGDIAFYNYLTTTVSSPRHVRIKQHYNDAEPALRAVIEELAPTHILVMGVTLWNLLPRFDPPHHELFNESVAGQAKHIGRYRTQSASPMVMCIKHPSTGFNGLDWHPQINAFRRLEKLSAE